MSITERVSQVEDEQLEADARAMWAMDEPGYLPWEILSEGVRDEYRRIAREAKR